MRSVIFALTGLGNAVLEALVASGLRPDLVVTRKEIGPYPYEPLPFIGDVADRAGIRWLTDVEGEHEVSKKGAELLLSVTYHRLIRRPVRQACTAAINLHPSLLPENRGPSPIYWSLRRGDAETGISAHALTDGIDDGPICMQRRISIGDDETQTGLRRRLGLLAGETAVSVVEQVSAGALQFREQEMRFVTTFPRVGEKERQLDPTEAALVMKRHISALREWPLAMLGQRRIKRMAAIVEASAAIPGTILTEDASVCRMRVADADVVLDLGS